MQEIGGNDVNSFVLLNRSAEEIPAFSQGLQSAYAQALESLYTVGGPFTVVLGHLQAG